MAEKKGRITGIGGVFFKTKNPDAMRAWYHEKFGLASDKYGYAFNWRKPENPQKKGSTAWNAFDDNSTYFQPSNQKYMINYRVENLEELIAELKESGVTVVGEIEKYEYGKFGWVLDPDGNKIELWEPVDEDFGDY